MSRYIDADAFIEDIKTEAMNLFMDGLKGTPRPRKELYEIIDRIEEQPTADVVEVRHGYWVVCGWFDDMLECSSCESEKYPMAQVINHKYCPNCGAKMDGERREG